MNFEKKIEELKIKLPEAKPPVGSYVATKISGNLLFISGQISIDVNGDSSSNALQIGKTQLVNSPGALVWIRIR